MYKSVFNVKFIMDDEIDIIIPLLLKLNTQLTEDILKERLQEMLKQNYKCVGVFDKDKLIGISGIWLLTKYYVGKHLEPDNVYILDEYQGKGIGKLLFDFIFNYAKQNDCVASELNCYIENKRGHNFWEKLGYQKIGYHFAKSI